MFKLDIQLMAVNMDNFAIAEFIMKYASPMTKDITRFIHES